LECPHRSSSKKRHEVRRLGVIERWFSRAFREKAQATVSRTLKMLEEANPQGYAACLRRRSRFDFRKQLGGIHTPVLGDRRSARSGCTPADGRFLADQIPAARYAELKRRAPLQHRRSRPIQQ